MADDSPENKAKDQPRYKSWFPFNKTSRSTSSHKTISSYTPITQSPGTPHQTITRKNSLPIPSPSVEPPQISAYKFTTSPSPIWLSSLPHPPRDESDGASVLPHISLNGDSLPLEDIPEGRKLGELEITRRPIAATSSHHEESPNAVLQPDSRPGPNQSSSAKFTMVDPSTGMTIVPKDQVINPAAFGITPPDGPKPPDETVFHAMVTRQGAEISSRDTEREKESAYQIDITPPISQREPPPSIIIDSCVFQPPKGVEITRKSGNSGNTDNHTWALPSANDGSLVPPVLNIPMSSPNEHWPVPDADWPGFRPFTLPIDNSRTAEGVITDPDYYNIGKPTCSLNLVCYRSGANGCDLQQVQCILRSKFPSDEGFEDTLAANPHLVHTDAQFFDEIRRLFNSKMSGFFRRHFSLKSLREFRVLAYTPTTRPIVVPFDDFVLQEMMFAYRNPDRLESQDDWIQWVFRLRRKDKRHAIEFVEGWNTTRIAIAGTIPWLSSCLVGILWSAIGGDTQTAFTVASFILTSSSIILALLAIISSIESSRRATT